jgi:hypothetical protein
VFKVGDQVFLSRKFTDRLPQTKAVAGTKAVITSRRLGHFEVLQLIGDNAYNLKLPAMWKAHDVVNTSYLAPANDVKKKEKYPDRDAPPADPDIVGGEQRYRVERLYNHRYQKGYLQ